MVQLGSFLKAKYMPTIQPSHFTPKQTKTIIIKRGQSLKTGEKILE